MARKSKLPTAAVVRCIVSATSETGIPRRWCNSTVSLWSSGRFASAAVSRSKRSSWMACSLGEGSSVSRQPSRRIDVCSNSSSSERPPRPCRRNSSVRWRAESPAAKPGLGLGRAPKLVAVLVGPSITSAALRPKGRSGPAASARAAAVPARAGTRGTPPMALPGLATSAASKDQDVRRPTSAQKMARVLRLAKLQKKVPDLMSELQIYFAASFPTCQLPNQVYRLER